MSYDVRIYLPQPSFPPDGWQEVLELVRAEERHPGGERRTWEVFGEHSVWLDLEPVHPAEEVLCGPLGTYWRCTASTSGASPKAIWTLFAVAYYALL
jgi:hypothetical protein